MSNQMARGDKEICLENSKLKDDVYNLKEELSQLKKTGACNACEAVGEENLKLRRIIQETLWMARRYADGRSTYAPGLVNENIMAALKLGIDLDGPTDPPYAKDGMFGEWNPETKRFEKG